MNLLILPIPINNTSNNAYCGRQETARAVNKTDFVESLLTEIVNKKSAGTTKPALDHLSKFIITGWAAKPRITRATILEKSILILLMT
jgi:hypothetical protein